MINGKLGKMGAAALRKTIQDIVGLNLSSIRYLVYVLLRAAAFFYVTENGVYNIKAFRRCAALCAEQKQRKMNIK